MAITKTLTTPQDNIRKGLSSFESCTQAIPTSLHELLFSKTNDKATASKHVRTKSVSLKSKTSERPTSSASFTDEQRSRVAVEVLNNVLQLLKDTTSSTSSSKSTKKSNLDHVIDCGRHSILYLNSREDCGLKAGAREAAHLNFINRLVQAGRLDIAAEELLDLKKRVTGTKNDDKRKILDILFDFKSVPKEQDALVLAIGIQVAGLKLLAAKSDVSTMLKLPSVLEAPSNILEMAQSLRGISPVKSAKQLDSVASAVYTCASALSNIRDTDTAKKPNARGAVELRLSSLHYRIASARSQGALVSQSQIGELWGLLAHLLTVARAQLPQTSPKGNYSLLAPKLKFVISELLDYDLQGFESKYLVSSVAVATFAEEAQCWDEALEYLQNVERRLNPNQHQSLVNACRIRLATCFLKAGANDKQVEGVSEMLVKASDVITQALSGSKEKLQSLFYDIMQLRRASSGYINSKKASDDDAQLCLGVCFAAIGFSRRCALAGILDIGTTSKDRQMIVSSIDNYLAASRKVPRNGEIAAWWELEDQRLQEILAVARLLDDAEDERDNIDSADSKQNIFEKLSVFYQQHSITLRKENEHDKSVQAFKRSIACIESRPPDEMSSGNLAVKHEKLGVMYVSQKDFQRALECFRDSLKTHLQVGDFEILSQSFGEKELDDLDSEEEKGIARSLTQYIKCCIECQKAPKFWDNDDLREEIRSAITFYQIQACLAVGSPKAFKVALPALHHLLSPDSLVPVDIQARAAITLVSIIQDLPDKEIDSVSCLARDVQKRVSRFVKNDKSDENVRIQYYLGFLSLSICLSSHEESEEKVSHLNDGLESWESLLQSCLSLQELQHCSAQADLMVERLNLLVDFLDMKGYSLARKQALELLLKLYKMLDSPVEVVVRCKISLGVQYLRLGFSGKSGSILSEADHWIKKIGVSTPTRLEWNLAYAEYLVSIGEGNLDKGIQYLSATQEMVDDDDTFFAAAASGAKLQKRVDLNRLVSRACYVSSMLALESGNVNNSITLARRSLKLMQRAWAGLEALAKHKSQANKSDQVILTYTTTVAALTGPFLWPIVRSVYDILVHIATLYLHQGMQRESLFYMQEARLVAEAVSSKSLLFHILSIYGDLHIRLGLLEEGEEKIRQATALKEHLEKGKELVAFDCTLGIMYRKNKSWAQELDAYNNAEKTLEDIIGEKALSAEKLLDITEKIGNLQIATQSQPKRRPTKSTKAAVATKGKASSKAATTATSAKTQPPSTKTSSGQCATLLKLRDDVLRLKAVNLAIQQKWDLAQTLLGETASSSPGSRELVAQKLAVARSSLLQALAAIEEDDEFHTLQETAIAIPSVSSVKVVEAPQTKPGKKTPKKTQVVTKELDVVTSNRAALLLQESRDNILAVQTLAAKVCGTTTLGLLSAMLGEVVCLLAAITSDSGAAKTIPAINSLELFRSISLTREKSTIEEEKHEATEADDLRWPSIRQVQPQIDTTSVLNFQKEYVDILPPTWAAISISLGESREELFFTRYQSGQIPFMVRVPLTASEELGAEEEEFGFEKGLALFHDIVKRANTSTHSAKDMTTKDIRAKWWSEREALDNELHDLLLNIENNWLRGYKGIFGNYKRHPELVSRFSASLTKILNQHLPSRNYGKKKNSKIVTLDERVVELFLGIGDPTEEDVDLDDSIQDLIYLVIDILQFHGEKNAPDEIDLDEMIVLITDALESYHKAANEYEDATTIDHTVLILDKTVHVLPWESMPCLDGRSVSRLPSLASLRERIQMQAFSSEDQHNSGIYINRSNTGYILNPALDLTNTQKTYEDELKSMTSWEGLIGKIPTERDFARYLDEKELFLYFGHGSGAQYIRARTVKKLNKCAVSLLMGCSSGKLTDAGDFEPYGMPLNYIQGGCPAAVVTLWDVTDKDIDKYSSKIFDSWGLFKEEKEKKVPKGKGKLKVKADEQTELFERVPSTTQSLCEAVATSRTACKMRYLNGAAPVVYGVPVYLK